jgi:peptidoglycan hydrolase CwlO-like protein
VLEHSAHFLSNIHDEHKSLKLRLETVAKNIETTKTVNKDATDRLIDLETQSLRKNLLFFAIGY